MKSPRIDDLYFLRVGHLNVNKWLARRFRPLAEGVHKYTPYPQSKGLPLNWSNLAKTLSNLARILPVSIVDEISQDDQIQVNVFR